MLDRSLQVTLLILRLPDLASPHNAGEQTVFPLPGGGVDHTVQLVIGHRLWIEVGEDWLSLLVAVGSVESLPGLRLSGSRFSHNEHRVTDIQ